MQSCKCHDTFKTPYVVPHACKHSMLNKVKVTLSSVFDQLF